MSSKVQNICDDYGFRFLDNVNMPFSELIAVGKQSRNSNKYYWNNKNRPESFLFQYTLKGSGTVETDGKCYIVSKGQAFFLKMPGEECYYFDEKSNTAPWEFIYIIFSGLGIEPYYEYIIKHLGKIFSLSQFHPAIKTLTDLYNLAKDNLVKNAFTADSEILRFLCSLCNTDISQKSDLINNAIIYLENNYKNQIILARTAEYLGVSQSHLSREFVKHTGEQPRHYLTKIRIKRAVHLLNSTDMTIDEISNYCGFSDSNYFSKVFRKYMNASPGEFRKQMKVQGYISVKI